MNKARLAVSHVSIIYAKLSYLAAGWSFIFKKYVGVILIFMTLQVSK